MSAAARVGVFLRRLFDRRLLVRLVALAAALVLYYALEWRPLREITRTAADWVVVRLGHTTVAFEDGAELLLRVDGRRVFSFGANCTWADLWLITAPFLWRFGRPVWLNLARLVAMALAIFPYNIARIAAALHWEAAGLDWRLVHNLPDLGTHLAVMIVVVLLALRADAEASADAASSGQR